MTKLLLLHGALGCSEQFAELASKLSDWEIFLYDFPGHGKRGFDSGANPNMNDFAQDLLEHVEKLDLKGATVLGHSMGGYCAALCEIIQPNTFERIITLGTKWEWNAEIAQKETVKRNPAFLRNKAPAFIDRMITYHGEEKLEELFFSIRNLMTELGNKPPIFNLKQITIPIKIFRGTLDRMVSAEESVKIANSNPLVLYFELHDTKHAYEDVDVDTLIELVRK